MEAMQYRGVMEYITYRCSSLFVQDIESQYFYLVASPVDILLTSSHRLYHVKYIQIRTSAIEE